MTDLALESSLALAPDRLLNPECPLIHDLMLSKDLALSSSSISLSSLPLKYKSSFDFEYLGDLMILERACLIYSFAI